MQTEIGATTFGVSVSITDNTDAIKESVKRNISEAVFSMATAIKKASEILAPKSEGLYKNGYLIDGNLRNSGHIERDGEFEASVIYGNSVVPYARYQEAGGDGVRVVRNYTTPGTQAHYLRDGAERIAKEGLKRYLR